MTDGSQGSKLLLVEDEALLLFSIADELRDAGFDVVEASNADQAIAMLKKTPQIRLLFTDIDMPGSMDGLQLSAFVRDHWPPVKIIVTSGKERPPADKFPSDSTFLPKPYSPSRVAAAISELLR
jgi:CheY-like chemotaxis protein